MSQRIVEHPNKLLGEATLAQCSHAVYFADPGQANRLISVVVGENAERYYGIALAENITR